MVQDYLGNVVTGAGPATLGAVDDFIGGFLAYQTRAEGIARAADQNAHCCIANVYAGLLWMMLEAPEAPLRAAKYLAAAEHSAPQATRREQLNAAVLRAWIDDDLTLAGALCRQASDEFPRDLAMVKLEQYFEFNRGDAPAMLKAALKVLERNADIPYMHGMAAFAYEECHLLDEAESAARTALGMQRREPWAQHALAHVMLARGAIDEGARFLESVADTWTGLNSFMVTHLWWHLALLYLSQGREAKVLELYDRHCWGVAKEYSQDQIGAVSLLARMELAGIDVGARWQDLADHLAARSHDTVLPFLTLQYLYGLARAGRAEAATLLEAVRETAARETPARSPPAAPLPASARPHDDAHEVWREVALPACEGLCAHARGDYETAWRRLSRAMPRMIEVGGSHAQRDLFEQILLDSAIRSARQGVAQQMLELRRLKTPDDAPLNTALAIVYGGLGLPALADRARRCAAATRARHPE
ncbi:MAG TPA: tetratricopeptide repeat protein [Steroidobacteraceae bacterium]|nr:tetratricopeptide repeat protein [Steroidobacteraceae bacterium]